MVLGEKRLICGPCSAESREQVIETAKSLSEIGIREFRAGVWKPRTKPGGFEGVGEVALEWLEEVKHQTGMKVATEVATAQHVEKCLNHSIDILWIGARTSSNPFAVQEIADCLKSNKADVEIFVKNPQHPDLEAWIGAIERISGSGVEKIGAINRGFTIYGETRFRNAPQWSVAIELHRRMPHLEILADPSHICGRRDLIEGIAQCSLDLNYDGLMLECHIKPECALTDARQQITPQFLKEILSRLIVRAKEKRDEEEVGIDELSRLREEIDECDSALFGILSERLKIAREIGQFKLQHGMTVVQPERYNQLLDYWLKESASLGISEAMIKKVLTAIHEESVKQQVGIISSL